MVEQGLNADAVVRAAVALLDESGLQGFTMRVCLDLCTSITGSILVVDRRRRVGRDLRLVATDMSWSRGDGPEVAGSGEALLMAIAGRRAALTDLTGPGVAILADRLPTTPVRAAAA